MEMRRQERQAKRAHTKRCHKSSPRSKAGKAAQNDEPGDPFLPCRVHFLTKIAQKVACNEMFVTLFVHSGPYHTKNSYQ